MKTRFLFTFIIFVSVFCFFSNPVLGAKLYFEAGTQEVKTPETQLLVPIEIKEGEHFQINLFLDAQDEAINAIEGEIIFPADLLETKEILEGDSIISLWVQKPAISSQSRIIFSGVVPGGFRGVLSPYYTGYKPGKILTVIFKAKVSGEGSILLENEKVLLNDGLGTAAKSSASPFLFRISKDAPSVQGIFPINDPDAPEPFEPAVARDEDIFNGKWFLVFAAQDKGSGIDYYAVYESRKRKQEAQIREKDWVEATSPYLLKDQSLRSFIYVKAVDKAGNERIAELSPQNPVAWYKNYFIWSIVVLLVIIVYFVTKAKWKRRKNA